MPGTPSSRQYRIIINGKPLTFASGLEWFDVYPERTWKEIAQTYETRGGITAVLERRYLFADAPDNRELFPDATRLPAGTVRPALLITTPETLAELK